MNEIAQWIAIFLVLCAVAWLFVCVYSDRWTGPGSPK